MTKEERRQYDESLKHFRDTIAVMHGQYLEGLEKGMEQGMEKGLAKGMAKGRAEANADNAKRMKSKGYAIEDIADITGLTADEIAAL